MQIIKSKILKGFSLLELIVVIAIVGIIAGVTAPKIINTLNVGKLRGEANKILSTLRYAQGMAAMQRATYKIKFNLGNFAFDDEKEFSQQSYQLIRDESRSDYLEFTDEDLMSSGESGLFPGQQKRFMPSADDFDYKDEEEQELFEEDIAASNRNIAGIVEIFDEKVHKLPPGIKIEKIIDGRDEFDITDGEYTIPINPKGRSLDSYIYISSSRKNAPVYIIHLGMNGLSEMYINEEE